MWTIKTNAMPWSQFYGKSGNVKLLTEQYPSLWASLSNFPAVKPSKAATGDTWPGLCSLRARIGGTYVYPTLLCFTVGKNYNLITTVYKQYSQHIWLQLMIQV